MPRSTELPPNVRRLVEEIETEIGESSDAADDISGDVGREYDPTANGRVEAAVREILTEIGDDPDRDGLLGTPERVHRMYTELTAGYHVDPERLINGAIFDVGYSEMVVVKAIPFYSLCEHHLLPFFGSAAVAYIPRGRVIGLSKIPRVVEMYARRLQVQERLTQQVAEFLQTRLEPQGVGVVMEATHLCAVMRGVRKPGTIMTRRPCSGFSGRATERAPSSSPTSTDPHPAHNVATGAAHGRVDACAPRSRTSRCARSGARRRLALNRPSGDFVSCLGIAAPSALARAGDDIDRLRAAHDLDEVAILRAVPARRVDRRLTSFLAETRPIEEDLAGAAG